MSSTGAVHPRPGERSYRSGTNSPAPAQFDQASATGLVLIEDLAEQRIPRAGAAAADGRPLSLRHPRRRWRLLGLLDDTRQTVGEYQRLEQERGRSCWNFPCFIGFAASWWRRRCGWPGGSPTACRGLIGRLAEASEQVGEGNLDLQIPREPDTGDDPDPGRKL